ncbi:hypothetical protein NGA_0556300, partial [Nannochloropsis gaditana CCMP526]
MLRRDRRSLPG